VSWSPDHDTETTVGLLTRRMLETCTDFGDLGPCEWHGQETMP
jgi:hypothetical protein